ncbi:hypothetical protein Drorol1_Dr00019899 [Drosera rotundifolia]
MSIAAPRCCFLVQPPSSPDSNPSKSSIKTTSLPINDRVRSSSWKSRCVMVMACTVIGFEISSEGYATTMAEEAVMMPLDSRKEGARWSSRSSCPAWNVKGYEIVVPENLPRPAAKRRWEAVGHRGKTPASSVATGMTYAVRNLDNSLGCLG